MTDSKSPTAYQLQFESILYIHENILRAFAAMNLGIISYYLAKYFYDILVEKYKLVMIKSPRLRTVIALISICILGGVWQSRNIEDRRMDVLCIILWLLAIIVAGIHVINIEDHYQSVLRYNRKLQLAVFLNHYPLLRRGYGGWMYLMSVFVISILEVLVVEGVKHFPYKFWVKWK